MRRARFSVRSSRSMVAALMRWSFWRYRGPSRARQTSPEAALARAGPPPGACRTDSRTRRPARRRGRGPRRRRRRWPTTILTTSPSRGEPHLLRPPPRWWAGRSWGPHSNERLIPPRAADEIHIVLFDIENHGYPTGLRIVGYFSRLHSYLRQPAPSVYQYSSGRLALFLDSPYLASATGETWDVTDRRPSTVIGTLAHEFQHMIHFYQKPVLRDAISESWLNEQASEVAEDLIAAKMMIDGPRAVAYDDPGAGEPENRRGRPPDYNLHNDIQVTAWDGYLANYSINYALGAYLARNYGGGALYGDIVQSDRSGVGAIEAAVRAWGHDESFLELLANWAAATCCRTTPRPPPRTNTTPGPGGPPTLAARSTGWGRSTCTTTSTRRAVWRVPVRTCTRCPCSTTVRSPRTPTCQRPHAARLRDEELGVDVGARLQALGRDHDQMACAAALETRVAIMPCTGSRMRCRVRSASRSRALPVSKRSSALPSSAMPCKRRNTARALPERAKLHHLRSQTRLVQQDQAVGSRQGRRRWAASTGNDGHVD